MRLTAQKYTRIMQWTIEGTEVGVRAMGLLAAFGSEL